jgi:hypothetical protein
MDWIHQPVTEPRWEETSARIVRNPMRARKIPKISSFLSLEILFHCQAEFEEERRELRVLVFGFELDGGLDRDVLFGDLEDVLTLLDDLDPDLLRLDMGFCAKRGLQNRKVVVSIFTGLGVLKGNDPPKTPTNSYLLKCYERLF